MTDEEIVVSRLELIQQYADELREMRECSREEFVSNTVQKRAVERSLMNAIQSCIDLASHIRAGEELGDAETSREEIQALATAEIISTETESHIAEAVGLRNRLAHRYDDIDHDIVYDVLQDDLQWFDRYQTEIAEWYQETHL